MAAGLVFLGALKARDTDHISRLGWSGLISLSLSLSLTILNLNGSSSSFVLAMSM